MCAVKKFGVTLPNPNRRGHEPTIICYTQLQNREWLAAEIAKKPARQIAQEIGCSIGAVMYGLQKFEIKIPKRTPDTVKGAFFRYEQLQNEEWFRKEVAEKPLRQIAREVGCSYGAVMSTVRKFKIDVPQRSRLISVVDRVASGRAAHRRKWPNGSMGPDAANWKGGRRLGANYNYVYQYAPDHPYATVDGYVMEHRLVMEKQIGRTLLPSEIVHHRNGDSLDNRPENLELVPNKKAHWKIHFTAVKILDALRQSDPALAKRIATLETELGGSEEESPEPLADDEPEPGETI